MFPDSITTQTEQPIHTWEERPCVLSAYQFEIYTHIYIFFLHIYAIFTCYKTTELLGTRLRDNYLCGFFFKEIHLETIMF